jgi:dolichol-phosphate mannosyltransferase
MISERIDQNLTVGVVICAKNEERTIEDIIDKASRYISIKDIFVIDGHSTDNTALLAREKGVSVLTDSKKGKGSAVRMAINKIEREILIFLDADGSHRPEEIPSFIEPFLGDRSITLIIGSRFKGGSEELGENLFEKIRFTGNKISTFILNKIWSTNLTDIQNGFRAVKRQEIQKYNLTENSFVIEQEMVMKCLKNKAKVVEIPSWELKRKYNKSHLKPLKMLPLFIISFFKNV